MTAGWGGLERSPANTATLPTNFHVPLGGAELLRGTEMGNPSKGVHRARGKIRASDRALGALAAGPWSPGLCTQAWTREAARLGRAALGLRVWGGGLTLPVPVSTSAAS